jgi:hypothetical protein
MEKALETFKAAVATGDDQEVYAATCACAREGIASVTLGRLVKEGGFPLDVALNVLHLWTAASRG